jgi:hypothetical protein
MVWVVYCMWFQEPISLRGQWDLFDTLPELTTYDQKEVNLTSGTREFHDL